MRSARSRALPALVVLLLAATSIGGCAWLKSLFGGRAKKNVRLDVLTGPLEDAVTYPDLLFVVPTGGPPDEETSIRRYLQTLSVLRQKKGGDPFEVEKDTEVTDLQMKERTLVLYGEVKSNHLLARFKDHIPVTLEDDSFSLGKVVKYAHPEEGIIFCCPNYLNPKKRYLIAYTGNSPRAIKDINSVLHGKTDFVVFNSASKEQRFGRENIYMARGFFDKTDPFNWKVEPSLIEYPFRTGW